MANNEIRIDEQNNRAIVWLDLKISNGKIRIPSYIDNDPEVIQWVKEYPGPALYARYSENFGYLPYVRGFVKDENGKERGVRLHRYLYEKKHGKISDDMEIHHKNGLRHDNRLDNLKVVTKEEHGKIPKRTKSETPPNDPNGFTGTVVNPKSDRVKDEYGNTVDFENIRHIFVYVNSVFLGYYAPEETDAAAWQINVCRLLFEEKSRQEIHRLLNSTNTAYNNQQIDKAIEAVLKLLNWDPPFLD
jgi:hypothetical protein